MRDVHMFQHIHVLDATQGICHAVGYTSNIKKVLTSDGNRRAGLSTSAWCSRWTCWWTSPCATISSAVVAIAVYTMASCEPL